jgi:hypothetical protein
MAISKVHTSNYLSLQTFEQHMRVAWRPTKEVKFTALEENLFTIQCFCLGDWLKVDKTWLSSNPMTVTRVNSTNFQDVGLRIGRIGRRMNSKVKNQSNKACIENKRGDELGFISICPWPASPGSYI